MSQERLVMQILLATTTGNYLEVDQGPSGVITSPTLVLSLYKTRRSISEIASSSFYLNKTGDSVVIVCIIT